MFLHISMLWAYLCAAEYVDVAGDDIMSLADVLGYQEIDCNPRIQLHRRN